METSNTLAEPRAPVPAGSEVAALERSDEITDLNPVVRQVDVVEEKALGDTNERVVKVVVRDFQGQDRGTIGSTPELIPNFGPDYIPPSFNHIRAWDLDGVDHMMDEFDGKVKLVTNVASLCTTTRTNYDEMRQLYDRFLPQGFEILGFPCQQFKGQEYDRHEDIKAFLANYNVAFPVFEKTIVNGPETHPVFRYCKWNSEELYRDGDLGDISWNFGKFLLDRDNRVYKYYAPEVNPLQMVEDIKKLLRGELKGNIRGPDGKIHKEPPAVNQEDQTHWS
ncbi:peroxiredoxin PRX2 [Besnoitia besnoiti]|uniref:Glutathione peroxidase n=1 Tax=Besnoitia besnoiti TaxID=94643 RepID=A0A2A9ML29_BESBE|nr:peroxiredoxin PRX2 [Besnoitia besnoiti]PFH36716.1 peroxiredoxin PRX2 [Besnoitia besnoiti]